MKLTNFKKKIDDIEINQDEELVTMKGKINLSELQEELEEAGFIPSIQSQWLIIKDNIKIE